ncbi:MAG: DUF294 nucleotidyltransferase-like domain-containing protein [Puniceicoccaceae bacterium]
MKLSEHADHTEKVVGIRAEDIHKWIDRFFDLEGFDNFLRHGKTEGFDPYGHRKYRHCIEALEDAYAEFEGKYTREQIKGVFETHLKDDYGGYVPAQKDFEDGKFHEKYHEHEDDIDPERILSKAELDEYFSDKFYKTVKKRRESTANTKFWFGLFLPTMVAVLLFVSSIFILILPQFRDNLLDQKRLMIRELTASASSVIRHYTDLVESGEFELEEAQARAAQEISSLRYGDEDKDYFWITDMHPRMVMHPYRTDLTGSDLSNYVDDEDRSGKRLFVEFVKLVEADNEGYLEYYWQWKDDPERMAPKLSYVRGIPEWGWIIGTGVYINDVDQEIGSLTRKILITFAFITFGLIIVLMYILRQSLRIEKKRRRAETGLIEAKERYRTLVESSNEGYVLELDGDHVYSNLAFQRMLQCSEEEALSREIWSSIIPDLPVNEGARINLRDVFLGRSVRGEFEARARKSNGEFIDVVMRVSRIFFSEKNGHVISLRPIVRKTADLAETLMARTMNEPDYRFPDMLKEIRKSESEGHVVRLLNDLPGIIRKEIARSTEAGTIRNLIASAYNETVCRYLELALRDAGQPPVKFSFLSLGSAARREMTLFSDQDNAVIFEDTSPNDLDANRDFFLQVTNRVCSKLDLAGFPFCQGGIMAANPKWCLSLSEWTDYVSEKFRDATPESLLDVNIFLDFQHLSGAPELATSLQQRMFDLAAKHPVFLACFARSYLENKLPLNLFGQLKTSSMEGVHKLNIKECLAPIVLFARLYALKNKIDMPATVDRLEALNNRGHLKGETYEEMVDAFSFFWRLRFNAQLREHSDLRTVDDTMNIDDLSDAERQACKKILSSFSAYYSKVSFDFLGMDPSLVD